MPAATGIHALRNSATAREVLAGGRRFFTTKAGGRLTRYASIGAGLGATRGLFDNIIGQDRVSVMGGAIQGAVYGAGFFGLAGAWKYGRAGLRTRAAARATMRGTTGLNMATGRTPLRLPFIQDRILGRGRGVMRRYWGM